MRTLSFVLAGLVAVGSPLRAASPAEEREVAGLLEKGGFAAPQAQAARALLDRAGRQGLPASMLVNRIREGIARRARPAAILGVLEDRLGQLEKADEIVKHGAQRGLVVRERDRLLLTLADALAQGVTPGDVLELVPSAARGKGDLESVARGAETLARLARKGFPPRETGEVVGAAVANAWPPDRMDDLVGLFLQAEALHLPPDEMRERLLEEVQHQGRRLSGPPPRETLAPAGNTGAESDAARDAAEERKRQRERGPRGGQDERPRKDGDNRRDPR
jgi:hypothetical protein